MKALKGVKSPIDVLFLSLAVQVDDVSEFIEYTTLILKRDVSSHMLECVCKKLNQQKLSMDQFIDLSRLVQLDVNTALV